jgi:hypothetical protein
MREEYATLARQFGATLYESYRPNGGISVVPQSSGGSIPSQGGVEGSYYPSGLFERSDDPLQFTSRLLWTNELHSLAIDHSSLQMRATGAAVGCSRRYFNFNGNRLRNGTLGSTVMAQSATGDTL